MGLCPLGLDSWLLRDDEETRHFSFRLGVSKNSTGGWWTVFQEPFLFILSVPGLPLPMKMTLWTFQVTIGFTIIFPLLHKEEQEARKEARGIGGKPWKDVERDQCYLLCEGLLEAKVRHTRFAV